MIIPQYLTSGDKVGVVATAKVVDKGNTLFGIDMLRQWGLKVEVGQYVFEKYFQFAGTDEQRTEDLQRMIDDPEISIGDLITHIPGPDFPPAALGFCTECVASKTTG